MKVHFIGIGGIGMSALAQYYLAKGFEVSGSDLESSEIIKLLKKKGAKIFIGPHSRLKLKTFTFLDAQGKLKNVKKSKLYNKVQSYKPPDLVIYSAAIPQNNVELREAKRLKIKCQSYSEALGELTKKHWTIAVAGTHGKSTTTTMLGLLLVKAGLDPTVIVGTKVKEFGGSNFRIGESEHLVIEACEYEESFLNYSPDIAVITNIKLDHLDYFKNFNNIKKAFAKFAKKLKKNGVLITEKQYKNSKDAKELKKILKIPGEHNVSNALAALAVARALKVPDKISFKALSEYSDCWRRFEIIKILYPKPYTLISDYAHHPTEVKATLKAAGEEYSRKKIWCVFQPHQYQRTWYLFDEFVKVFQNTRVDKLIITDIYKVAGREEKEFSKKMNAQKLVKAIKRRRELEENMGQSIIYIPFVLEKIADYLKANLKGEEVVIIMGAGNIYKLIDLYF